MLYLVMELVPGQTLAERSPAAGCLSMKRCACAVSSPTRLAPRINEASLTGISSLPTSSSLRTAGSRFSTSVWRNQQTKHGPSRRSTRRRRRGDVAGSGARDPGLYEPRADPRRAWRHPIRSVGVWLRAVRSPLRAPRIFCSDDGRDDGRGPDVGARLERRCRAQIPTAVRELLRRCLDKQVAEPHTGRHGDSVGAGARA